MIRKKKLFVRPRKMYEKTRISEENALMEKYGLKTKREIWKALAKINYFRSRAKVLSKESLEEQQLFFNKLSAMGIKVKTISDVLALKLEDLLERRLPTIVFKKKLATTTKQARQMVVHKNVFIDGKVLNIPSYIVPLSQENSITVRKSSKPAKAVEAKSEEAK